VSGRVQREGKGGKALRRAEKALAARTRPNLAVERTCRRGEGETFGSRNPNFWGCRARVDI